MTVYWGYSFTVDTSSYKLALQNRLIKPIQIPHTPPQPHNRRISEVSLSLSNQREWYYRILLISRTAQNSNPNPNPKPPSPKPNSSLLQNLTLTLFQIYILTLNPIPNPNPNPNRNLNPNPNPNSIPPNPNPNPNFNSSPELGYSSSVMGSKEDDEVTRVFMPEERKRLESR